MAWLTAYHSTAQHRLAVQLYYTPYGTVNEARGGWAEATGGEGRKERKERKEKRRKGGIATLFMPSCLLFIVYCLLFFLPRVSKPFNHIQKMILHYT